jgi:hypothetical protein
LLPAGISGGGPAWGCPLASLCGSFAIESALLRVIELALGDRRKQSVPI